MAAGFFVVPSVTFRLLLLIILAHDRRRIVHVAVTEHPTAVWTAQQLRNAFSEHDAPRYLLHDRDSVFAYVANILQPLPTCIPKVSPCRSHRGNHTLVASRRASKPKALVCIVILGMKAS
jgi:hypothetical protein